jgi:hypothetical protein
MITPCIEEICSGNGTKIHMNPASKKYGVLLLGALVLFGCAGMLSGVGTNVLDEIAWDNFETFQIDPDMNYYASGPHDDYPIVIMGLKKQYVLDNDLWRPLPSDPQLFKHLIKSMQFEAQKIGQVQRGFALKSPEGQDIGICYCRLTVWINVKMGEGNKVIVYTPDSEENSYTPPDRGDGQGR